MPSIAKFGKKFFLNIPKEKKRVYMGAIATITGQTYFVTHLKEYDKHHYHKKDSYPINKQLIDDLEKSMINQILVPVLDDHAVYKAQVIQYQHAEIIHEPNTEPQYALPLTEMEKIDVDEKTFNNLIIHIHGGRYYDRAIKRKPLQKTL